MSDLDDLLADLADSDNGSVADDQQDVDNDVAVNGRSLDEQVAEVLQSSAHCANARDADITLSRANELITQLDDAFLRSVTDIRQVYDQHFPDLSALVPSATDYVAVVSKLGDVKGKDVTKLGLAGIVPPAVAMSIGVSATTTKGASLSVDQLARLRDMCEAAMQMQRQKTQLMDLLESRITMTAPNLAALVGAQVASRMVASAGGLAALARTPSCNIASIGKRKTEHGDLYYSQLVQECPEDVRKQALRQVGAKVVLAARIDTTRSTPSGERGAAFHDELSKKLEKLAEPPEMRDTKALPAPDDPAKKRRGGKKARKAKERYAVTDMQRLRNRMAFGEQEDEVDLGDETEGLGMLKSDHGGIRGVQIDARTKARLPKEKKKGGHLTGWSALMHDQPITQNTVAHLTGSDTRGLAPVSGTQSSFVFNSHQGIQLPQLDVDAVRSAKQQEHDNRWFKSGTFTQINKDV